MTITEWYNKIPLKTRKLSNGDTLYYLPMKFKAGQKILLKNNFVLVNNPTMLKCDDIYASYNSIMKCWIMSD